MEVLAVSEILRCGATFLVNCKGIDGLTGLKNDAIYDFAGAFKKNIIAMTDLDRKRIRSRISKKVARTVAEMWEYSCAYCFTDLRNMDYHIDHIIPVVFGGSSGLSNLALACKKCYLRKSDKLFPDLTTIRDFLAGSKP